MLKEEDFLVQLMQKYEGNKNINKLIADHFPSKTAKQVSDKKCLILSTHQTVVTAVTTKVNEQELQGKNSHQWKQKQQHRAN